MSEKRYMVRLSEEERAALKALLKSDKKVAVRKRLHAQILLKVDQGESGPGWPDHQVAEAFDTHVNTVHGVRRRLVEQGFEAALNRQKQVSPSRKPLLNEDREKDLLTIAKAEAPKGRARWTLHLLAGELVRLKIVESISHETVRKALKKTPFNPISK
jgi:transposase